MRLRALRRQRLCRVIQECRAAVAKRRNERQREVRAGQRALREAELNQAVTELHQRHDDAEETLEDLLRADWRVRVGYRRRREQVEREARRGGDSKQAVVATKVKKRRMYVEDSSDSEAENASEDEAADVGWRMLFDPLMWGPGGRTVAGAASHAQLAMALRSALTGSAMTMPGRAGGRGDGVDGGGAGSVLAAYSISKRKSKNRTHVLGGNESIGCGGSV